MFASLLVANRGEIACRIFRTARAMGLQCIAVYSDADAKAKHVREADLALRIGPAPARDSYLKIEAVLAAAKEAGAEAIHPGYGFLSENPDFAEAVIAAGLGWIGPPPAAIRAMGLKDQAKRIAEEAGAPVLPGYRDGDQNEKTLKKAAGEVGYPVLIKAIAGGGGRGIREVREAGEFAAQLSAARREAAAAFGDDRVLIEKLVERPRHIEVQVFGDSHGNLVHLYERDCSLQRRRQKVIEEAPAPGMTDEVRAAMTEAALNLARAVKYENAGTAEFIVDGAGPLRADGFWFMEMNTRLQVEHPVTEAITGIDLVEWQLRAAAGEALPLRQDQIHMHGHAVEARLCAEDPADDFRPSAGRIERLWGSWGTIPRPREDAGFDVGDAVPPFYDSLLSKVIVSDSSRTRAFGLAMAAVGCVESIGIKTNAGMLAQTLGRFSGDESIGELNTGALQESDLLWPPRRLDDALIAAVAAAAVQVGRESRADGAAWAVDGWRLNGPPRNFVSFNFNAVGEIAVAPSAHMIAVDVKGECFAFERRNMSRQSDGVSLSWWQGPRGTTAFVMIGADMVHVFDSGWAFKVPFVRSEGDLDEAEAGDAIAAPLPGKVVAAPARVGQAVKRGEALITIEAMKMEHALKAPRDGVIAEIAAGEGAQVKEGQVLVRLAPVEEAA